MKMVPEDMVYPCTKCGQEYKEEDQMDSHMNTHMSMKHNETFPVFFDKESIQMLDTAGFDLQAMLASIQQDILKSEYQDGAVNNPPNILDNDNYKKEDCNECNFHTTTRTSLVLHKEMVHNPNFYTCDICTTKTKTMEALAYHKERKHIVKRKTSSKMNTTKLVYKNKSKGFNLIKGLRQNKKLEFKCEKCEKTFTTKQGSSLHNRKVHDKITQKVKHICDICNLGLCSERALVMHKAHKHPQLKRSMSHNKIGESPQMKKKKEDKDKTIEKTSDDIIRDSTIEEKQDVVESDISIRFKKLLRPKSFAEAATNTEPDENKQCDLPLSHKEMSNTISELNHIIAGCGDVIANLEEENDDLHKKVDYLGNDSTCMEKHEEYIQELRTENLELKDMLNTLQKYQYKYICNECEIAFTQNENLNKHITKAHSALTKKIDSSRWSTSQVKVTVDSVEEEQIKLQEILIKPLSCTKCAFKVDNTEKLDKHMQNHDEHSPMSNLSCISCDFEFVSKKKYKQHMKEHHLPKEDDDSEFTCPECQYQTNDKNLLMKHMKETNHKYANVQSGDRNPEEEKKCYTCKDMFKNYNSLMNHRKMLHPSNIKCRYIPNCKFGRNCWYVHSDTDQTDVTDNTISQKEPFKTTCHTCNMEFTSKYQMMNHKKTVHTRNIQCKEYIKNRCRRSSDQCWFTHEQLTAPPGSEAPVQFPVLPTEQTQYRPSPEDFPQLPPTQKPPDMLTVMISMVRQLGMQVNSIQQQISQISRI
jgi:hypothetical protein